MDEWFYKALAGIRPDPERPGFQHFFVHPRPVGGLTWVRAGFESVRGRIVSEWRIERGRFLLNVTVPANAKATVYVPTRQPAQITESGKPVRKAPGVRFVAIDAGCAVFELNSGRFAFAAPYATDRKR